MIQKPCSNADALKIRQDDEPMHTLDVLRFRVREMLNRHEADWLVAEHRDVAARGFVQRIV